jgi:2-phospho-L-lactate guanylyltransferase
MRAGPTWAIVPVKALSDAKRRLSAALSPELRRRLVLTMLENVLTTLGNVETIDVVLVVTPDPQVAALAAERGAAVLREERATGLNPALVQGLAHARLHGARSAIIVPADLPQATAEEVRGVVAAVATGRRVALVPSRDGEGTNALALAPPDALEPSFGPGSFVRHLAHAVARRLDTRVLQMPGLAADIDEPHDIVTLLQCAGGSPVYDFLRQGEGGRELNQTGAREQ